MSTKDRSRRTTKDRVRQFNKHVLNPVMLRLAGRKHWYASAIGHTGRKSGRAYTTPVVADRVPDGFVVPLPYGTGVDWVRNIFAAGTATLRAGGTTYTVAEPRIIDAAEAATRVSPAHARVWRRFGIAHYLELKIREDT